MKIPRIMLAAPKSGSGKTLITSALLAALKNDGHKAAAFKCGPDYIDPMFHRTAIGVPSENLDTYFSGEEGAAHQMALCSKGADIAVVEGVMGLYDGLGGVTGEASSYHVAQATGTPIVLVVDARGTGRSLAALVRGFKEYDSAGLIRGVILNRVGKSTYSMLKSVVESETGVPVTGFFPAIKELDIESRHLGLRLPSEMYDIQNRLGLAAGQLKETCGFDALLKIAGEAGELSFEDDNRDAEPERGQFPVKLAVARDEAFCFYYGANLRGLEAAGTDLCFFSPIHDKALPGGVSGLLLGGGYPELYAGELSDNVSMRESIKSAIDAGMPSAAECGGFMYLHERIKTENGEFPMAGAVKGEVFNTGKPVRFGYVEIKEKRPGFLGAGETIKGHEFHYFDSTDNGCACTATKPVSGKSWECAHAGKNHFWGFAHLYYPSAPSFARHFAEAMREYSTGAI